MFLVLPERARQRLLLQNEELDDDQSLNNLTTGAEQGFFELQLLLIPWQRLDHPDMVSNYEKLREAVEKASSKEVERLLRILGPTWFMLSRRVCSSTNAAGNPKKAWLVVFFVDF